MDGTGGNVAEYYDNNTESFLRFGHGGAVFAIHRAVWGPGVETREQALQFAEKLITDRIRDTKIDRVIDLGCGCGASMIYILEHTGNVGVSGITLSRVQYDIGVRLLRERKLSGTIHHGSYLDADFYSSLGLPGKSARNPVLFFAIEAFLHSPGGGQFFATLEEFTLPGDRLIIIDDFASGKPDTKRLKRLYRDFLFGWRVSNLITKDELQNQAGKHGFALVEDSDLSEMLELNRFRDIIIRLIVPFIKLMKNRPFSGNLIGGNALQVLLLKKLLRYRSIVLERR